MITYQYAQSDEGITKYISNVSLEYRKHHNFTCYGCGGRMIARLKADKREPHFAHYKEGRCSKETYLHQLGKKMFVELYDFCRTNNISLEIEHQQQEICNVIDCPLGVQTPCKGIRTKKILLFPDYTECSTESYGKETGFRPDILLSNKNGDKIYIEIFVTHENSQKKRDSGIPIIEFPIYDESDLDIFRHDKIFEKILILQKYANCYNIPNKAIATEKFCTNKINQAKNLFKKYYEKKIKNKEQLNILVQKIQSCQQESCKYQLSTKCSILKEEFLFNLTDRFTKIITPDCEDLSSNIILEDKSINKLKINFSLDFAIQQKFNKNEPVIQFIFNYDTLQYPWEDQEPLHQCYKTRFYNFKEYPCPNCIDMKFRVIILYKNGFLYDSENNLNIEQIESKLKENLTTLKCYVLLDPDFLENICNADASILLRTAFLFFKKYYDEVKNCLLCTYCNEETATLPEDKNKFFCNKHQRALNINDHSGCPYFAIGYRHFQNTYRFSLPLAEMKIAAYRNRISFVDEYLLKENETAK